MALSTEFADENIEEFALEGVVRRMKLEGEGDKRTHINGGVFRHGKVVPSVRWGRRGST